MPVVLQDISSYASRSKPRRESAAVIGGIEARERRSLVDWLDDRLRAGQRGRLEAEYPISLREDTLESHRVARLGGVPVAHAMFHVVIVRTPNPVTVGMIGLVYTEPEARGRGLAQGCIEACIDELAARDATLALLWSEKHDFYQRLGFTPFGVEVHYRIDAGICRRARRRLEAWPEGESENLLVDEARSRDWVSLERLYAAKPVFTLREPGSLRRLAAAPDSRIVVARRDKVPVAYVAVGRGDDFRGVAHEWAGSPAGVVACLETLCTGESLYWFRGPSPGPIDSALEPAGARSAEAPFALGRVLDPNAEPPASIYLWGFDSI